MQESDEITVSATTGGMSEWLDKLLFSDTFFTVFFAVVLLLVVAGFVTVIVMLIRGKKSRYVMMHMNDDGTMHPVSTQGAAWAGEHGIHAGGAARQAHNAAHQQALNQ